ncbi:MAG: IS1634 family transposase [Candidatus Humimicrobiaceae bacterium]
MEKKLSGLYVANIKSEYKGKVYESHLLRRSYRDGKKVKQKTIANISPLPQDLRDIISKSLKGEIFLPINKAIEITRSRAHGNVAAVKKVFEDLDMDNLICPLVSRQRDLVKAMIISRIIKPQTKLATTRSWHDTTLPELLNIEDADEDELYEAMDWLVKRQPLIETKLAGRHLKDKSLALYDVSSSYYEGSCCSLASYGYNRDKKKGKCQIVYGLLTDPFGRPVSIQVYEGSKSDTKTVDDQIKKLKDQFGLKHFVFTGDRAMITQARIEKLKRLGGIDWISALRNSSIRKLVESGNLQLSLFDERNLAEIISADYPGERLIVCKNPYLAQERAKNRIQLLNKTEEALNQIAKRVAAGRLKEEAKIGQALGKVASKYKMSKHFKFSVSYARFSYSRNQENIEREAALDGIYVIRTSVPKDKLSSEAVVSSYKSLSMAERAFRTLKGIDLRIRPIHHRIEERVRAHIFICMLAYYLEWHLRDAWKSLIFDDEFPGDRQGSPVLPAIRSESALSKASTKKLPDGSPVHSFNTLLSSLAMVVSNDARVPAIPNLPSFSIITKPNPTQKKALELVGLDIMT